MVGAFFLGILSTGCTVETSDAGEISDDEMVTEEATEALCNALPATCPPVVPGGQSTSMPNLCNCRFYYECTEGESKLRLCPNKMHFSPVRRVCESPETAGCVALPL
ncbi:chitin binding peritrophin-A domain-containing protein [Chondromyces apiculatus]|uniref:Chitin-binding type-2 domain-containing protein n=1 Tax=Chondromyces apiculatus DSM 436 TaxID=1192034 RepID=A0A017T5Z5_9BACT|nr:chitin binding peritrophin-A domain-containing protein [Chondromyces apiculatus]EYF04215.1 Hypothetical protein CAP_4692 [Chondromyces apiculatus DSM 436]